MKINYNNWKLNYESQEYFHMGLISEYFNKRGTKIYFVTTPVGSKKQSGCFKSKKAAQKYLRG